MENSLRAGSRLMIAIAEKFALSILLKKDADLQSSRGGKRESRSKPKGSMARLNLSRYVSFVQLR